MIDPSKVIEIGKTGVSVTQLGLGGAPLAGMELPNGIYGGTPFNKAIDLIRTAYDVGIRYFDTAPLYGEGRSENRYGAALKDYPFESYTLSTKVGRLLIPENPKNTELLVDDGIPRYKTNPDYSRDGIRQSLEESLDRLGYEKVDILYVHDHDFTGQLPESTFTEALSAISELQSEGVVKAIGMGMNEIEITGRMIERFDLNIVLLASRYTLLDQSALLNFLPLCLKRGVQLAIGAPFNSGILSQNISDTSTFDYKKAPPAILEKARRIKKVCDRYLVDLRAAALQFPFAHPSVATIVPGAKNVEEVSQNIQLLQQDIPFELWSDLKKENLLSNEAPTP